MADRESLFPKTDLASMSQRCFTTKKFVDALQFDFDMAMGFTKYQTCQKLHEAGFDAYLTGCVFASIAKHLEVSQANYKGFKLVPTASV